MLHPLLVCFGSAHEQIRHGCLRFDPIFTRRLVPLHHTFDFLHEELWSYYKTWVHVSQTNSQPHAYLHLCRMNRIPGAPYRSATLVQVHPLSNHAKSLFNSCWTKIEYIYQTLSTRCPRFSVNFGPPCISGLGLWILISFHVVKVGVIGSQNPSTRTRDTGWPKIYTKCGSPCKMWTKFGHGYGQTLDKVRIIC